MCRPNDHIDVVPVLPTSVEEWTYPPYSGYFDGVLVFVTSGGS